MFAKNLGIYKCFVCVSLHFAYCGGQKGFKGREQVFGMGLQTTLQEKPVWLGLTKDELVALKFIIKEFREWRKIRKTQV